MNCKYAFLLLSAALSMNAFVGVAFADPFAANSTNSNACVFQNLGTYSGTVRMVPVYVDTVFDCERGYYLPKLTEECTRCTENHYCPGGQYNYSDTLDVGITACPSGTFARAGMWEAAQCGRKLHVGDVVLYLRSMRKTAPALYFDLDRDGVADYFANMTPVDVAMNSDTNKKLKVSYGNNLFSVYDDSIDDSELQQSPVPEQNEPSEP